MVPANSASWAGTMPKASRDRSLGAFGKQKDPRMMPASENIQILRWPIPKTMSFPVGYEILFEHFGEQHDWPQSRLVFFDRPTAFASEFTRILKCNEPYCILELAREPEEHVTRHRDSHWCFTVYPVLRKLKNIARGELTLRAFAILRDFMATYPVHPHYSNRIRVIFDPVNQSSTFDQLHQTK